MLLEKEKSMRRRKLEIDSIALAANRERERLKKKDQRERKKKSLKADRVAFSTPQKAKHRRALRKTREKKDLVINSLLSECSSLNSSQDSTNSPEAQRLTVSNTLWKALRFA